MSDFLNIESVMGKYNSIQLGNARDELNKSIDTLNGLSALARLCRKTDMF